MKDTNSISAEETQESKPYLFCVDLAQHDRWNLALCCADCHADPERMLIHDTVTGRNPFDGRRNALLCCRCFMLVNDWFPSKHYHSLPEHDE
jgi:hypothetical protein